MESGIPATTCARYAYAITHFCSKSWRSRQTATSHDKPRPNDDVGDNNDKTGRMPNACFCYFQFFERNQVKGGHFAPGDQVRQAQGLSVKHEPMGIVRGKSEEPVVAMKSGNADGAKGFWFRIAPDL